MPRLKITPLKDKYYLETLRLFKDYPEEFASKDLSLIRKELLTYLLHYPTKKSENFVLVLTDEQKVIGAVVAHHEPSSDRYYQIDWLVVKKGQQNKGYGKRLTRAALRKIKERGYKHVYLKTSNEKYNERAKIFYRHLGFKKIGRLPRYYADPVQHSKYFDDCILFGRDL